MAGAPFDWAQYLQLAQELAQRQDEAALRTAISRAYYFAYHIATIRAKRNGYTGPTKHADIWKVYQRDSSLAARRLAQRGTQMKKVREAADYDAEFPHLPDQLVQQLDDANDFLDKLAALPAGSPAP